MITIYKYKVVIMKTISSVEIAILFL